MYNFWQEITILKHCSKAKKFPFNSENSNEVFKCSFEQYLVTKMQSGCEATIEFSYNQDIGDDKILIYILYNQNSGDDKFYINGAAATKYFI